MGSWVLKAAVQGGISVLPARNRLNRLIQTRVTGSVALTEAGFQRKVAQCRHHLQSYRQSLGTDTPPTTALELGTGWYPIVPIGLLLSGVEQVWTVDVSPLLELERARRALELYSSYLSSGMLDAVLPGIQAERAQAVIAATTNRSAHSVGELLEPLGVRVIVGDAQTPRLPARSVHLIVSNNTLEHIPPAELVAVMAECRRIAAPRAVMSHFIDMSDHYAHFDSSITEFNYLRYSARAWRVFNNRLHYQSRLRASDYRRIIQAAGFAVIAEDSDEGRPDELDQIKLAAPFRDYDRADLLVLRTWMTAVAAADVSAASESLDSTRSP